MNLLGPRYIPTDSIKKFMGCDRQKRKWRKSVQYGVFTDLKNDYFEVQIHRNQHFHRKKASQLLHRNRNLDLKDMSRIVDKSRVFNISMYWIPKYDCIFFYWNLWVDSTFQMQNLISCHYLIPVNHIKVKIVQEVSGPHP